MNKAYGLTTLRKRHLKLQEDSIRLEYRAKSGKYRKINIKNNHLVNLIRELSDLPGYDIFRYRENGKSVPVDSNYVNEYLREISNESFSSKDFR
ncbi:MAG: DNA topoisomerase IB, partial [Cyclobacteriaceae bacterium]